VKAGAPARRLFVVAAASGLALLLATGCSSDDNAKVASGAGASTSVPASTEVPPKIPDSISRLAGAVASARQSGTADLSGLSTAFLHVRADGAIEVVLRSSDPISPDRQAELQTLGAEVVGRIGDNGIQVWVPADKLSAVAGLPWVTSVSAPSYSQVGG
jgi:hypothetical protein